MTTKKAMTKDELPDALSQRIAEAKETGGAVSVVEADLDWFGAVNRDHGTEVGDEVLRVIGRMLTDSAPTGGAVFRYGGEEFVIVLPGLEKEAAFLWIEEVRRAYDKEHALSVAGKTVPLPLTLSAGVACYPEDGSRAQDVLRRALDALYRAKAGERNKVCLSREERMVTKTSHYTQGQLEALSRLAGKEGTGEAVLLREALDDLLRKYDS